MNETDTYIAFYGNQIVADGSLADMLSKTTLLLKEKQAKGTDTEPLLIFNERNGSQVDFDFRGTVEDVLARALPGQKKRGAGRPRLGVTSREITLLPRHWEWLESQPRSASASMRLLVEEAMKKDGGEAEIKKNIAVIDRIMMVMAGNLVNFEEASRSLNTRNFERFEACVNDWPGDIKNYLLDRIHKIMNPGVT